MPTQTKLSPPRLPPGWVPRRDLIQRLVRSQAQIVVIEAPAGYGKTTLAAQWRATSTGHLFAWLSLDDGDADPRTLWLHVVHALRVAGVPFSSRRLVHQLSAREPALTGVVLPGLINELAALDQRVTLVLDGYQAIRDPRGHEQLTFFLLHLPATVQVALLTRSHPALPLARFRTAGQLLELGPAELRFSPMETAVLLRSVSGVTLSRASLVRLGERTEGWPAAVGLAALSLRDGPPRTWTGAGTEADPGPGENRFVSDFVQEEIISRQPPRVQRFLIRTSILDRLCAPLCDAMLGTSDAADLLDFLVRELLLIPLDEERRRYRYHPLVARALRAQLDRDEPGLAAALHERASRWHRSRGTVDGAVAHAVASGDLPGAVSLISGHWHEYASSGRLLVVQGWLRLMGEPAIAAHPSAAHVAAWAAALAGDQETARRWVPVMAAAPATGPLPDGIRSLRSSAALLRGVYGFEGIRMMREAAVEAAALEDDPASPWYALAQVAFGYSRYLSGEAETAEGPLRAAVASRSAIPMVHLVSLSALALTLAELGQVAEAGRAAEAACQLAALAELRTTPQASLAWAASGVARAAAGRLRDARDELERAVQSRLEVPRLSPWPTVDALLRLAQVQLDLGGRAAATAPLDRARLLLAWCPDGADVLLARLDDLERRLARWSGPLALPDPLTDRELAVLRVLRGPLPVKEIAVEMGVSANTIKSQVRAVYQKLGVSTRQQAIERGQQAGLL